MTTLLDKFSKTFIGIEFKEDKLVFSCLKNDLSGLHLLSSASFPRNDKDENIAEIKSFLDENVRGPSEVFVCIPYSWSFTKFTDVPLPKARGKDTLTHLMKFETERHIPFEIDDVYYDFQALEQSETTSKVIMVSVHKDKINYVNDFLEKVPLKPYVITLSPFAVLNSIECSETSSVGWHSMLGFSRKPATLGGKDEKCILLFMDRNIAYFAVLSGGYCLYLSSVEFDRNETVDAIADVISSQFSAVLPELLVPEIHKLLLSGSINSLAGLSESLNERLNIQVQTVNPVSKYLRKGEGADSQDLTPSIGVCYLGMGMGTIRMNLLPYKVDFMLKKTGALFSKISIPLIVLMIIGIFTGAMYNNRRHLTEIDKKIEENAPEIKTLNKITSALDILEQQKDFFLSVHDSDIVLDILSEITTIVPTDAWISNLYFKEFGGDKNDAIIGEMTISGFAKSSSILISLLEDSPYFEKVEFVGPVKKRRDKEGFKIKFVTLNPLYQNETSDLTMTEGGG
jgi:Tfp pilus assembly PilM family ATPase